MWLADIDFVSPKPVVEAIEARLRHPVFGYPYEKNEYKAVLSNLVKNKYS